MVGLNSSVPSGGLVLLVTPLLLQRFIINFLVRWLGAELRLQIELVNWALMVS